MTLPLICLAVGLLVGKFVSAPELVPLIDSAILCTLCLVVFCAGVDAGARRATLRKLREYGLRVLLYPLAIMLGSIAGGLVAGIWMGIPLNEACAVAAGVSYYSLSSGLLTALGGARLGALAFVSNVLREMLALICTPLVAKTAGKHPSVAPGGAAAMDTVLGVIARSADEETALIAMISGVTLSLVVPLILPLLYRAIP